jgi:hypothetical protein
LDIWKEIFHNWISQWKGELSLHKCASHWTIVEARQARITG